MLFVADSAKEKISEIRSNQAMDENFFIRVFNRAGGQVAELPDLNTEWNAANMPDGIYWWILYERFDGQSPIVFRKGGLKIKR